MGDPVTINLRHVARGLGIPLGQVQAVLELLDEGNTVPFITRYRKDQTGGLDEQQIRQIQARLNKLRLLAERKQTILRSIESQGKLTEKLAKQIRNANTAKRLEDLYLPYKPKKQTLATVGRSRGLEPLAGEILGAEKGCEDLDSRAADFANPDRGVPTAADALLGAGHIIAEQFSERADLRQRLREILSRSGKLVSTQVGGEPKTASGPPEPAPPAESRQATAKPPADAQPPQPQEAAAQPAQVAVEPATPPAASEPAEHEATPGTVDPAGSQAGADASGEQTPSPGPPSSDAEPSSQANPSADPPQHAATGDEATDKPSEDAHASASPPEDVQAPNTAAEDGQPPDAPTPPPEPTAEADDGGESGSRPEPPGSPEGQPSNEAVQPAEVVVAAQEKAEVQPESPQPPDADSSAEGPSEVAGGPENAPEPKTGAAGEGGATGLTEPAGDAAAVPGAQPAVSAPAQPPPPSQPAPPTPAAPPRARQVKADRRLSKKEQKKKKAEERRQKAFRDYFDYREEIKKIPPHRVLAINRGERAKILRVKIECDVEAMHQALEETCVPEGHPHAEFLRGCARDALGRLILPSLEREARRELTERAETHAVGVFARNLRNLLLQPPVRGRRVLAVDPGYRSGCKLVALDQFGNLLAHAVIYLVGRPDRKEEAKQTVADLINRYGLTVVTIGNGTACREAENFFAGLIADELRDRDLAYVIVNEAGASVYSTSRVGREELPDYDATLRGAISIGRRLQDPLSELVKIDPANIGVGLYQHDVKAKHLRTSLDEVVESCVNYVGVDVNTASPALLRYVSGLNQLTARRVYEHRQEHGPFRNREQLRGVPGFGEATFVQAAGFLKITGGDNPLDATWIHPESYEAASRVMTHLACGPADLSDKEAAKGLRAQTGKVDVAALAGELQVGELLLKDILAQLARPGRDPREDLPPPVFKQGVLKLEDLAAGMELTGTVLNVVDFGAFVDIGMHDSGLVHVSQLADRFVRDPHDVIAVGDVVKVWVLDVDKERRRVSLTMIAPGSRHAPAPGRRESRPARQHAPDRPKRPATGERPPRPQGRPRPKGPPRGRDKGPPRPRYKPKSRPKPVTPITDSMKAGKEPMRSFSDLAQFFQADEPARDKGRKKSKQKPAKGKAQASTGETQKSTSDQPKAQTGQDEPDKPIPQAPDPERTKAPEQTPSGEAGTQSPGLDNAKTAEQAPPDEISSAQAEVQAPQAKPPSSEPVGQDAQDEPNPPQDPGQSAQEGTQHGEDPTESPGS